MKILTSLVLIILVAQTATAQLLEKKDKNGFTYRYAENDPLNARIYTLRNGLTVYLSIYNDEPRIQTYVAVRAGSKHDPADATGLAHYLEHILFKGTSQFGTADWKKEKVLLDKIEELFEQHRSTEDPAVREKLYKQIDSLSLIASEYALANEYDKMLSTIGAKGTNAYTWVEQTVYVNDIPANQIERWAYIESNRFQEVVPRLFHTELEAVYEEKNRALDSDYRRAWDAMMEGLFKQHPYGTQTTLGTIEHLKSPSITEIKKYFDKHYIPNNMAICLSGDLDPEKTITILEKYFGNWKDQELPQTTLPEEAPLTHEVVKEVTGPSAESVTIGFRLPGINSEAALKMDIVSMLLSNGQAGLLDLNLNQEQKVIEAYSYPVQFNDYSVHMLGAKPREGQPVEDVKKLLLEQLDLLAKGSFDDWLLEAVINDHELNLIKAYESNKNRADAFVSAFIHYTPWEEYITQVEKMRKVTKADIQSFVKKHYVNPVVIYKKTGEVETPKIQKPPITPVKVNRDAISDFHEKMLKIEVPEIKPVFVDFKKDMTAKAFANSYEVYYKQNTANDLFKLYFIYDFGKNYDPVLPIAFKYLELIGTEKQSNQTIKKELFRLGSNVNFSVSNERIVISLSGLQKNFDASVALLDDWIHDPKANAEVLKNLKEDILKERADAKLSKYVIHQSAMLEYAKYGNNSPFKNIVKKEDLMAITPEQLVEQITTTVGYTHSTMYYGPADIDALNTDLQATKLLSSVGKMPPNWFVPLSKYKGHTFKQTEVYWVNYDMVQAEIILLSSSVKLGDKNLPNKTNNAGKTSDSAFVATANLFNEYFGGNMGSIVFQEIREAKALAYSVRSRYDLAGKKDRLNYIYSYIGTQADKLPEAMAAMQELLNTIPESKEAFATAKQSLLNSLKSERITKAGVLFHYIGMKDLGITYDLRELVYKFTQELTFEDIKAFHKNYVNHQPQKILVIGNKEKLNFETLKKYGPVKELTLEEIFGY